MEPLLQNWGEHFTLIFGGAAAMGIVAHAVNTFPTPKSPIGAWLLGVVQYAVGQRIAAANTLQGRQSVVVSMPQDTKQ